MSTSNESIQDVILKGKKGQNLLLQKVDIDANVEGLLFNVKVRQSYKNTTDKNIETIYTFPLAWECTLLGLSATIGGKTWQGMVLPKSEAEENYEKAIKEGDTPIMVEKSGEGLYTAHMGNLKPDEEAFIEIHYAQLLKIEHNQLRLSIPTTIAPRYGDPVKTGKLKKPASVDVNPTVSYPFSLKLTIDGELTQGSVSCPSHQTSIRSDNGKFVVSLNREGYLDRDLVVLIDSVKNQSIFSVAKDGEEYLALYSLTPSISQEKIAHASEIELKILVDCSGSMNGDSIELARKGLKSLLPLLSSADRVSYSLFGSQPRRVVGRLTAATPEFKANSLEPAIDRTTADLGGTEMDSALADTFKISTENFERPINVLLITDGEVWDIENIIQTARESNHRIFAIGVGSSPADSLLREIAENSDGACELVSPNEDMAAAMQRMVNRMRQGFIAGLSIDWKTNITWHSPIPKVIYPGETIHLAAALGDKPKQPPTLKTSALNLFNSESTDNTLNSESSVELATSNDEFIRIIGAKRMRDAVSSEQASQLALKYQLVTEHTNLFMVIQRATDQKALGLPEPHQIQQMVAAGWHGTGTVRQSQNFSNLISYSLASKSISRSAIIPNFLPEKPAYMRRSDSSVFMNQEKHKLIGLEPIELLSILEEIALTNTDFEDAMTRLLNCGLPFEIEEIIGKISNKLSDRVLAWAIFLDWLVGALNQRQVAPRQVKRLLDHTLSVLPDEVREDIFENFHNLLPHVNNEYWGTIEKPSDTLDFNELIIRQNL